MYDCKTVANRSDADRAATARSIAKKNRSHINDYIYNYNYNINDNCDNNSNDELNISHLERSSLNNIDKKSNGDSNHNYNYNYNSGESSFAFLLQNSDKISNSNVNYDEHMLLESCFTNMKIDFSKLEIIDPTKKSTNKINSNSNSNSNNSSLTGKSMVVEDLTDKFGTGSHSTMVIHSSNPVVNINTTKHQQNPQQKVVSVNVNSQKQDKTGETPNTNSNILNIRSEKFQQNTPNDDPVVILDVENENENEHEDKDEYEREIKSEQVSILDVSYQSTVSVSRTDEYGSDYGQSNINSFLDYENNTQSNSRRNSATPRIQSELMNNYNNGGSVEYLDYQRFPSCSDEIAEITQKYQFAREGGTPAKKVTDINISTNQKQTQIMETQRQNNININNANVGTDIINNIADTVTSKHDKNKSINIVNYKRGEKEKDQSRVTQNVNVNVTEKVDLITPKTKVNIQKDIKNKQHIQQIAQTEQALLKHKRRREIIEDIPRSQSCELTCTCDHSSISIYVPQLKKSIQRFYQFTLKSCIFENKNCNLVEKETKKIVIKYIKTAFNKSNNCKPSLSALTYNEQSHRITVLLMFKQNVGESDSAIFGVYDQGQSFNDRRATVGSGTINDCSEQLARKNGKNGNSIWINHFLSFDELSDIIDYNFAPFFTQLSS